LEGSVRMSQQLINRNRYMRVQSYGDSLTIAIAKPFAEELGIGKQSTVKTWVEDGIFHARKAE
jgi:hypothetical protein